MAGLIERLAQTPVKIHIPTGTFVDSQPAFDEIEAKAFIFEREENPVENPEKGTINSGVVMLVAPVFSEETEAKLTLTLPAKVEVDEKMFDISSVRNLRNMKGELLGYRMAL
jgi:hypothetical protein